MLAFAAGGSRGFASRFFAAARPTLIVLYYSAAFWKLTQSFLDPKVSCANVLVAELATALLPAHLMRADSLFAKGLMLSAPAQVTAIEFAVPTLLWAAPSAGIVASLCFHLLINLMPVTYAGGFSIACCTKLLFVAPGALSDSLAMPGAVATAIVATATAAFIATHNGTLDAHGLIYLGLTLVYLHAVSTGAVAARARQSRDVAKRPRDRLARWVAATLAFAYGFIGPVLGLQAMASSTMFAQLNQFADPSNHYVVPTGVLFRPGVADIINPNAFGGGLVRLEAANSTVFDDLYYNVDIFYTQSARTAEILAASGSARFYFAFYCSRMMYGRPSFFVHNSTQLQFVVPAFEFRRNLAEARRLGQDFEVTYTALPRLPKNLPSMWREAVGPKITLQAKANGTELCYDENMRPCGKDELALKPPPPSWLARTLLRYPRVTVFSLFLC